MSVGRCEDVIGWEIVDGRRVSSLVESECFDWTGSDEEVGAVEKGWLTKLQVELTIFESFAEKIAAHIEIDYHFKWPTFLHGKPIFSLQIR